MNTVALFRTILISIAISLLCLSGNGQDLPKKIRGYTLIRANVLVGDANIDSSGGQDALVSIGSPSIIDFGWSGVTFEIGASVAPMKQEGRVDFITFREFTVNSIHVDIQEYRHPFALAKGSKTTLPKPAQAVVRTSRIAQAAFKEILESKNEWKIAGTAFVFGRFKKYGFSFKRVVPVNVLLTIPNPIKSALGKNS